MRAARARSNLTWPAARRPGHRYNRAMIEFPEIGPVALQLGPVAIRWYGLSYLAGIALGWWLLARRARAQPGAGWTADAVADLVFYAAVGGVLGGRLGYILFYNFREYLADPLEILAVWRGGMSFHGGVLGMVGGILLFGRATGRRFFTCADFLVPVIPIGLALGRVANFINQELWGAPTNLPWGVLFTAPGAGEVARHPTQLYEAALEGVLLLVLLEVLRRRHPREGVISGLFLVGYAVCRMGVELVREPDPQLGYLWGGWLTMGQVLSLPMLVAGAYIIWRSRHWALEGNKP